MSNDRHDDRPEMDENQVSMPDANNEDFEATLVEWLNNPPERTRRSVVVPQPAYLDRTYDDRRRFMERARPKITKDVLKRIIRGKSGILGDEVTNGKPVSYLGQTLLAHDMFRGTRHPPRKISPGPRPRRGRDCGRSRLQDITTQLQ